MSKKQMPPHERKAAVRTAMSLHHLYNGNAVRKYIEKTTTYTVSDNTINGDITEIFEENRRLYSDMARGGAQDQIITMIRDSRQDIEDLRQDIIQLKSTDDFKPSDKLENLLAILEEKGMKSESRLIRAALKSLAIRANIGKRAFAYDQLIKMRTFYHDLLMAHPLYDLAETNIGRHTEKPEQAGSKE